MTKYEALDYLGMVLQDYIKQVEQGSPGVAYALADTSNRAINIIREHLSTPETEKEPE